MAEISFLNDDYDGNDDDYDYDDDYENLTCYYRTLTHPPLHRKHTL